jgi:drug/metabolite transporter (DMT)-like permease
VIVGSIGVFWLYVFVVRRWTASAASYQLVLIPPVTVVVAARLHDERITWTFAVGSILVLIGVYFGALRPSDREATRPRRSSLDTDRLTSGEPTASSRSPRAPGWE